MMTTKLVSLMAIVSLACAAETRNVDGPGYISFPLTRRTHPDPAGKHTKRSEVIESTEQQSGTFYTIDITFGTPGQTVPVQIDTGSSELWVNPICYDSLEPKICHEQQRFTQSDTLKVLGSFGRVEYAKGWANFRYVEDIVTIGSLKVFEQVFGDAYETERFVYGLLGAGPPGDGWVHERPSLFDNLASQGHIQSRSFSMNLGGFQSNQGAIIFGGLDTGKFSGSLAKLPVVPAEDSPDKTTRWWVSLDGISVRNGEGSETTVLDAAGGEGQAIVLDSGFTMTALPPKIFAKLLEAFPEAKKRSDEYYKVDCLPKGEGGSISFTFGGVTISVPYYDFMFHNPKGENYCVLGAYESDTLAVLGANFLRAAYVVYDFDHQTVHIAQSAANCGYNVQAIGANGVSVTQGDCGGY